MDDGAMGSPMAAITNLFGGGGKKEDARGSSGSGKSSGAKSENNNIKFASFRAQQDTIQPGEEIFMDYYASINFDERPLDGKTCVDYGFVDPVERNGGYELRIGIPENDPNRDDKIDICDEKLLSIRVLLGEKKALRNTLRYFETIRASVDRLEYYQERRLRQLNLLDEDGSSTYDPFNDFIA
jgi:hypothetical protein